MRKRFVLVLTLVLILSGSSNIYAQQSSDINRQESIISPFFTYISQHYVYISKSEGKIKCESILSFTRYKARVTNTLQKQEGNQWTDVSSKSTTYSSPSAKSFVSTFSGTTGTKYRFKSLVEIIDASGKVLESASEYSNDMTY
jgi:hypothetical protein